MSVNRLLVVTHVPHYPGGGTIRAYAPYVRELDIWCDLFAQVVIASPIGSGPPPSDSAAFTRNNVSLFAIPKSGGRTIAAKLKQFVLLPWIIARLSMAMYSADAIHIRCPGNLGLLGILLGPVFSKRLIAKYAGQWNAYSDEARSFRLQRRLLASRWWRGPVTVYGDWPDQPDHIVPFFTSVMTSQQIERARRICEQRQASSTLNVIFVGRLSESKNVDVLLQAVATLIDEGVDVRCRVVGQGAEDEPLRDLAKRLNLRERVQFMGGVDHESVFDFYEQSDVLVLASETEGWPKVIAEAMACGLVCVGSNRGLVPWMLSAGRGLTVEPGDVDELAQSLRSLSESPENRENMSVRASEFGQRYSLDTLREELAKLMSSRWETSVSHSECGVAREPSEFGDRVHAL